MRHIEINNAPPEDWIKKANIVTNKLLKLGYCEECLKIIEQNSSLWRDLQDWLSEQSHGKCWYTESRDSNSYWHVDHYRPKAKIKDLNGVEYEGYWWLAFNWKNYRLAGSVTNIPKSIKFPVRPGTARTATHLQDYDDESPYLLDPVEPDDPGLLSFDNRGIAMPSQENNWHKERTLVSIEILNLNGYTPLVRARKNLWQKCERHTNRALNLFNDISVQSSITNKTNLKTEILELKSMVRKDSEFSSVACICIRSTGINWLINTVFG